MIARRKQDVVFPAGDKPLQRCIICVSTMETTGFFKFEININVLVASFRFIWIYICYGSTVIRNI